MHESLRLIFHADGGAPHGETCSLNSELRALTAAGRRVLSNLSSSIYSTISNMRNTATAQSTVELLALGIDVIAVVAAG